MGSVSLRATAAQVATELSQVEVRSGRGGPSCRRQLRHEEEEEAPTVSAMLKKLTSR